MATGITLWRAGHGRNAAKHARRRGYRGGWRCYVWTATSRPGEVSSENHTTVIPSRGEDRIIATPVLNVVWFADHVGCVLFWPVYGSLSSTATLMYVVPPYFCSRLCTFSLPGTLPAGCTTNLGGHPNRPERHLRRAQGTVSEPLQASWHKYNPYTDSICNVHGHVSIVDLS